MPILDNPVSTLQGRFRKIVLSLGVAGAVGAGAVTFHKEPHVIQFNPGGSLSEFYELYSTIRTEGRNVRIDGMCLSACTMVAGLIPPERICVTPYAVLGFHSAYRISMVGPEHSSEGTRMIWQTYPATLRRMLIDAGWNGDPAEHREDRQLNKHPQMIFIRTPELYAIFRPCP